MQYGRKSWLPWVEQDEEKIIGLMKAAFDAGIRTFDTADVYSYGVSEELVGKFLKRHNIPREHIVILTKIYEYIGPYDTAFVQIDKKAPEYINQSGLSRKYILAEVEASTKRLGTYIDVLQIHRLDHSTPKEEIMEALHDVVKSGKVRYLGASSMKAVEFAQLQFIAEKKNLTKFISMQGFYNLIYREEEREMIPFCNETGVGLIPWSPIAQGFLARPPGDRSTTRGGGKVFLPEISDADEAVIGEVEKIAKARGTSMAIVSMAWVLSKGANPIVGLSSQKRIDEAVEAVKFKLTEDEIATLEKNYKTKPIFGFRPTD